MHEPAFTELRELRARCPELIAARASERRRRPLLGADGRLMIVAADPKRTAGWPTRWPTATTCCAACTLVHDVPVRP